jgi:hypothetical protein
MTPQESELIAELFDRLAQLENSPRDADAERAIAEGLRRAPHAAYALVQTVLVQDEALKAADARIRALQASPEGQQPSGGGFLGSMRDSLLGRREAPRSGSVPQVRPEVSRQAEASPWNQGPMQPPPPQYGAGPGGGPFGGGAPGGGGSFLGNAAATAAGVIGGGLLLDSVRSMFGGHRPGASAAYAEPGSGGSPWSGGGGSAGGGGSDQLSRDAGLGDVSGGHSAGIGDVDEHDHGGAYETADNSDDPDETDTDEDYEDDGGDDGDGDTDYA